MLGREAVFHGRLFFMFCFAVHLFEKLAEMHELNSSRISLCSHEGRFLQKIS
jgi:hypothetical protein